MLIISSHTLSKHSYPKCAPQKTLPILQNSEVGDVGVPSPFDSEEAGIEPATSIGVANESVAELVKDIKVELTKYDDDALFDPTVFKESVIAPPPEELIIPDKKKSHLSIHHQTLHLPACPEHCRACKLAKATTAYARQRANPGITVTSKDAEAHPFGACLHLDHWTMRHNSEAASAAKFALSLLDEKTAFKGLMPTNSRSHAEVVQQIRHFEGVEEGQQARRWWTDCAP